MNQNPIESVTSLQHVYGFLKAEAWGAITDPDGPDGDVWISG